MKKSFSAVFLLTAVAVGSLGATPDALAQKNKKAESSDEKSSRTGSEPPGAKGALPTTMEKITQATDVTYRPKSPSHRVKFNLQDADLAELVNHISGMTGKRFIYGAKVRQVKATVVSPQPVTLEEAYQTFLSILQLNGMTVLPRGRFLEIVDSGGITGLPTPIYSRGGTLPNEDRYITRLYRLQHVSVEEISKLLAKFKSKEGDVSVYAPGQLLIITDTGPQIRRLIRIVEELDVGGAGQRLWVEPIHYTAASEIAQQISDLFDLGGKGETGGGLSKVIADEQTNSLLIVGLEDSYLKLLDLLKRLDVKPTASGKVHVLRLQHADAEELSKTLTDMLGQTKARPGARGSAAAKGQNLGGTFEGNVRVTADTSTNSLVVTSSNRDFASLRMVVHQLDMARRQVFIEAVIMDLSVDDSSTLGFSFHGGATADLGGGEDSVLIGGFRAPNTVLQPPDPSLLQGFAAGVTGPELDGTLGAFQPGVSIPAFGVLLNAMASNGKTNILATPHIIATDNVEAEINIGENIPLQQNVGSGLSSLAGAAGGQAGGLAALGALSSGFSAPRQDVGNRIRVTPHINESDQVRLEIELESSAPGAPTGQLGAVPIVKRTTNTTVVVEDQQTIVIGGLMRDEYTTSKDKVPILGDIPLLGVLFRSTTTTKRKANLLLVLTPHVIRDQDDLRRIFEKKMQERQEFLDRHFVFTGEDWAPPHDYSRTNGLVEDVRQAHLRLAEQVRLEEESRPSEVKEHQPTQAIDLPHVVQTKGATGKAKAKPARSKRKPKAKPPASKKRSAAPRTLGGARAKLEPPLQINRIARSVNVERIE